MPEKVNPTHGTFTRHSILPCPRRLRDLRRQLRQQRGGTQARAWRNLLPEVRNGDAKRIGEAIHLIELAREKAPPEPPRVVVVINRRARGYRLGALKVWVRQHERGTGDG